MGLELERYSQGVLGFWCGWKGFLSSPIILQSVTVQQLGTPFRRDMAMLRSARLLHRLSGAQHIRAFAAEAAPEHENVLQRVLSSQLSDIRAAGTYKSEVELVSPQGPSVRVADVKGEVLNFCAPLAHR